MIQELVFAEQKVVDRCAETGRRRPPKMTRLHHLRERRKEIHEKQSEGLGKEKEYSWLRRHWYQQRVHLGDVVGSGVCGVMM